MLEKFKKNKPKNKNQKPNPINQFLIFFVLSF